MAYKDKEKQKEASKERQRRYRALRQDGKLDKVLRQGVTKGVTSEGVTDKALLKPVISKTEQHVGASQIKDVRALHKEIGQQANVIPLEWSENEVTPEGAHLLEEVFGKDLLETGLPDDKPRAKDKGSTGAVAKIRARVNKEMAEDIKSAIDGAVFGVKPRATDPDVQTIWDGRNAQGQAAGYSAKAQSEDYPQTQRPMR